LRNVYVVGVGQVPVTKDQVNARHIAAAAVREALADGAIAPEQVDALYVGNMTSGILSNQQQLGSLVAESAGLRGIEALTVEAACAGGGAATRVAYQTIAGGLNDVVVVCGLELMTHVPREAATRALATAADWESEGAKGESFLTLSAKLMSAYMARYDVAPEMFAPFAETAHTNALGNRNALLHKSLDTGTYLDSRVIVGPIRLFDCSPVCNGAAALVLASEEVARSAERKRRPAVRIAGSAVATAPLALARRSDALRFDAVASSTTAALDQAGIAREDVDLFELHDAYTIVTALCLEAAGFAKPGMGTYLAQEGEVTLQGRLPIATMGGLKARGHPVGATGVYQLAEAHLQLTGRAGANQVENAEVALVQNLGGIASTAVTHVLSREA
jgi:acetyl-CoA C-acetyltransferase